MYANILYLDMISVILLILLIIHSKQTQKISFSSAILTKIMFLSVIGALSDLLYAWVDGTSGFFFIFCNQLSMFLYFSTLCLSSYLWLFYICIETEKTWESTPGKKILIRLPILILLFLCLCSPVTGWIFSFDSQNHYVRGSLYFLQPPLTFFYVVYGAWISFDNYRKAKLPELRRYYLNLTYYVMIPIIGGFAQGLSFGSNYLTPAVALSLTMLYLDNIRKTITLDSLTQLNNRGQFDIYLKTCIEDNYHSYNLHLVFFDIDKFKLINDTYGHLEGDHAIVIFSHVLKQTFAGQKAFLARYGGDEFAVIIFCSDDELDYYILRVQQSLTETSKSLPYTLGASFGIAHYDSETMKNSDDFIKVADDNMYQQKQAKHQH